MESFFFGLFDGITELATSGLAHKGKRTARSARLPLPLMSRPSFHALLAVVALVGAGCLESTVAVCAEGRLCPSRLSCDDVHEGCVLPQQIEVCEGREQGASCTYVGTPDGRCYEGVCLR